jgi:integrase
VSRHDLSISIRQEPQRPKPWGAFWREYKPGVTPRKQARFFDTQDEAERFKAAFLAELDKPTAHEQLEAATPARRGTLGAYLADWLRDAVKPHRTASTYRSYEQLVRLHISPKIGTWKWADVGSVKVRQFYEDLFTAKATLATRKHVHSCLSSAFGQAVEDELITHNPCLKLGRRLRHKGERDLNPEPNPFTREDAATFLADVAAHEPEWVEYFQFLHDTGVRVGEVAALKWEHVDLDGQRAKIEWSFSPSDGADTAPKTHRRRWVDLSDLVVDQLRAWRTRQREWWLKRGRVGKAPSYVFTNRRGSPRRQDGNMRRVFDRLIARTGLPSHTPHDLRDTFATTHLTDNFAKLPWVSRQLGHESERTTVEHYYRFLPDQVSKGFANQIRR